MHRCLFKKQMEVCYATPKLPNVCLSLSSGVVTVTTDIKPSGAVLHQTGLCPRIEPLSPLYSSSQPCNWRPLTQRNLWPWWIVALKTTTKLGLHWSVVTLGCTLETDRPVCQSLFGRKHCVFCQLCVWDSVSACVCFTMETLGMMSCLVAGHLSEKGWFYCVIDRAEMRTVCLQSVSAVAFCHGWKQKV